MNGQFETGEPRCEPPNLPPVQHEPHTANLHNRTPRSRSLPKFTPSYAPIARTSLNLNLQHFLAGSAQTCQFTSRQSRLKAIIPDNSMKGSFFVRCERVIGNVRYKLHSTVCGADSILVLSHFGLHLPALKPRWYLLFIHIETIPCMFSPTSQTKSCVCSK